MDTEKFVEIVKSIPSEIKPLNWKFTWETAQRILGHDRKPQALNRHARRSAKHRNKK